MIDKNILEKLAAFDTPTVCNAIELFDIRPPTTGYLANPAIRQQFPADPIVGFASTAVSRSAFPASAKTDGYDWLSAHCASFSELIGQAIVVIQDLDDPPCAAQFGEIMCSTYQHFGAVGLITNGAARDVQQIEAINFPIFATGATASHGHFRLIELNIPVQIGGMIVRPDALLHADCNGVTVIPSEIASEVGDVCEEFVKAERIYLDALNNLSSISELREAIAETTSRISSLARR